MSVAGINTLAVPVVYVIAHLSSIAFMLNKVIVLKICDRCRTEDDKTKLQLIDIAGVGRYDLCPRCLSDLSVWLKAEPQKRRWFG